MNKGTVNIITVLAAILVLGGCATTTTQQPGDTGNPPILSAADARSMISVEVRELEALPVELALAHHSAIPSK